MIRGSLYKPFAINLHPYTAHTLNKERPAEGEMICGGVGVKSVWCVHSSIGKVLPHLTHTTAVL